MDLLSMLSSALSNFSSSNNITLTPTIGPTPPYPIDPPYPFLAENAVKGAEILGGIFGAMVTLCLFGKCLKKIKKRCETSNEDSAIVKYTVLPAHIVAKSVQVHVVTESRVLLFKPSAAESEREKRKATHGKTGLNQEGNKKEGACRIS